MNQHHKRAEAFEKALGDALKASGLDLPLFAFDELDSTNRFAKDLAAREVCQRALIVALSQSAGRGRMGRTFYSPAGSGVYFSLLFPLTVAPTAALSLTAAAAVAVMRAIRKLTGKQVQIKWVNDLYLNEKKVCGILAESILSAEGGCSYLVLGIGVNWYSAEFPDELFSIAGSVGAIGVPREALIACVTEELLPFLEDPKDHSWLSEYRSHSAVLGKRIKWIQNDCERHGDALDIDDEGGLLVQAEDGETVLLRTGEISVRLQADQ